MRILPLGHRSTASPSKGVSTRPVSVVPQAPTAAVLARQKEVAKASRSTLAVWLSRGGWAVVGVPILVIGIGLFILGPSLTGELLLGLGTPALPDQDGWKVGLAWVIAIIGWLAVPSILGSVIGYLVTVRLSAYRSRTLDEIAGEDGLDVE